MSPLLSDTVPLSTLPLPLPVLMLICPLLVALLSPVFKVILPPAPEVEAPDVILTADPSPLPLLPTAIEMLPD